MSDSRRGVCNQNAFECWSDAELKAMGLVLPRYRREMVMEAAQERTRVSRQRKRPALQQSLVSPDKRAPEHDPAMGDPRFPRRRQNEHHP